MPCLHGGRRTPRPAGPQGLVQRGRGDVDSAEGDVAAAEVGVPLGAGFDAGNMVVGVGWVADGGEVAIEGPTADEGESLEVDLFAGQHDFLADAAADDFGGCVNEIARQEQHNS